MFGFFLDSLWGNQNSNSETLRCWYIIMVRPNQEKMVHEKLAQRGIESFQPLVEETRQWSDRKKRVEVPLLPGYGFVHINAKERVTVLTMKGVLKFVALDRRPAVVSDEEIRSLQLAVGSAVALKEVDWPRDGEEETVQSGPLAGIRGIVTRSAASTHVVIPIECLGKGVAMDLEPEALEQA